MKQNVELQTYALEQRVDDTPHNPPDVTRLARAPVGPLLAAGHSDGSIRVWNTATRECVSTFQGHRKAVTALAFSRDGELLASGGQDTNVVVWDTLGEAGMYRLKAHTGQVNAVCFLDGHHKLLSAGKDGCLRVWSLSTQHCAQVITNEAGARMTALYKRNSRAHHGQTELLPMLR